MFSENQFMLSFVSFPVAKQERMYFWAMTVISEQLAAGVRTGEGSSSVVMHFLALGCLSAGQGQRGVLGFSLGSGVMLPQPSPPQSSPKSIPACSAHLLTSCSSVTHWFHPWALRWSTLRDFCAHCQVAARVPSLATGNRTGTGAKPSCCCLSLFTNMKNICRNKT